MTPQDNGQPPPVPAPHAATARAPAAAPSRPAQRRRLRWLVAAAATVAVLLLVTAGTAWWVVSTPSGLQASLAVLTRWAPFAFVVEGGRGRWLGPLHFDRLKLDTGKLSVEVIQADLDYAPVALGQRRFEARLLKAAQVRIAAQPAPDEPAKLPPSLELPAVLAIERLEIGRLDWLDPATGVPRFSLHGIAANLHTAERATPLAPAMHRVEALRLRVEADGVWAELTGSGRIAVRPPYALQAELAARGAQRGNGFTATATAGGTLAAPRVQLKAQGHAVPGQAADPRYVLSGEADALLAPFAGAGQAPVSSLKLSLHGIDPAAWEPRAPHAALSLAVDLKPEGRSADGLPTAVAGTVALRNAEPGTIDKGRLPLRTLESRLRWQAGQLQLSELRLQLPRGTVQGGVQLQSALLAPPAGAAAPAAGPAGIRFTGELRAADVDLSAIASGLQATRLDARVRATGDQRSQSIQAHWEEPRFAAQTDVALAWPVLEIKRAELEARNGAGRASLAGRADLAARSFDVRGTLERFDPSLLTAMPRAQLTADLESKGRYGETPQLALRFALKDSWLTGLPGQPAWKERVALTGEGRLALSGPAGRQRLETDTALQLGSNRVTLTGALGDSKDRLTAVLDLPAPGLLLTGTGGRLRADLELGGALSSLRLVGKASAEQVSWRQGSGKEARITALRAGQANWRADGIDAQAWLGGRDRSLFALLHKTGMQAALSLQSLALPAEDGRGGLIVSQAQADFAGQAGQHKLSAAVQTAENDAVRLTLEGGLRPGDRWEGRWTGLDAVVPTRLPGRRLTLLQPAALRLAREDILLTNAVFGAAPTEANPRPSPLRIAIEELSLGQGRVASRGRFTGVPLVRHGTGLDMPAAEPAPDALRIGGRWDLVAGNDLRGQARIERESGDLYLDADRRQPAGLATLFADLRAQPRTGASGSELVLTARAAGTRVGTIDADLRVGLSRGAAGWVVMRDAPLNGRLRADIPNLDWVGATLGGRTQTGGSLKADVAVARAQGAAAEARAWTARGTVQGRQLRVALIDAGVRLHDGTLDARVDGDTLHLTDLSFHSQAEALPRELRLRLTPEQLRQPGALRASGRLNFATLAGEVEAQAEHFHAVQRDDRWVALTGKAQARFDRQRGQVSGQLRLDPGYIEYNQRTTESAAPVLAEDIVIKGRNAAAPAKKNPYQLAVDMLIDLGPRLFFNGEGLEARLAGQVRLRSDKQAGGRETLRAFGSVAVRNGTFEAYGQKLDIERGIINFQGPLDDPGLNVLAVRKGLAVEAGVSITRSAKDPDIRIVSDPPLPDLEKLSWLVLGRPPEQAAASDAIMLLSAARDLAGNRSRRNSKGLTARVAEKFGLDDLSVNRGQVGSSDTILAGRTVAGETGLGTTSGTLGGAQPGAVSGQVLSIGKRLSSTVTLSYEQALGGTANMVRLSYRINRRLSIIARAGTDNALDLVYSFAFD
jgi:translocation and assembly module TamB